MNQERLCGVCKERLAHNVGGPPRCQPCSRQGLLDSYKRYNARKRAERNAWHRAKRRSQGLKRVEKRCECGRDFVTTKDYSQCAYCRREPALRTGTCGDCGTPVIKTASFCRRCGPRHRVVRRGRFENASGYVLIYSPDHLRVKDSRRKYVLEHVLVMERHLGRYLRGGENVHHKNGIRADNRIENLELWVSSQPSGQRVLDLLGWARELLQMYESEQALL